MKPAGHRKVLIVSWAYYPRATIGAHRAGKFAKYLPEFGWWPTILSVHERYYSPLVDPSLWNEIRDGVEVVRTADWRLRNLGQILLPLLRIGKGGGGNASTSTRATGRWRRLARWFEMPEDIGWVPFGVLRGCSIARRCDVIWATSPPPGSLCVAALLSRLTGKPLVIDLRDPWRLPDSAPYPTFLHRRADQAWEAFVFRSAAKVVLVTDEMKSMYEALYPRCAAKLEVIYNGHDVNNVAGAASGSGLEDGRGIKIGYFGSLYGGREKYMLAFLRGLSEGGGGKHDGTVAAKVYFRGPRPEVVEAMASQCQAANWMDIGGPVPHKEAMAMMANMDVLLVVNSPQHPHALTGKVFDYIGVRKPILAVSPDGAISRFLARYDIGVSIDPLRNQAVSEAVRRICENYPSYVKQLNRVADKFSRRVLTEQLCRVLESVV